MKEAAAQAAKLAPEQVECLINGGSVTLNFSDGSSFDLGPDDMIIQRTEKEGVSVATEGGVTLALDTVLNEDLLEEGFAREFVSKIQNMRKEADLEVSDRIVIKFTADGNYSGVPAKYSDYICGETLAVELIAVETLDADGIDINGHECKIIIDKK